MPAAVTGPAGPHSEGSGWDQGSKFWAHSKPGAGRHLWAGLSPKAISVTRGAEQKIITCLNLGDFIIRQNENHLG